MKIELDELLKGCATTIKGKQYFSAEQYVTPFLEATHKVAEDYLVEVIQAPQISVGASESYNIFNRVYIQALTRDLSYDNHKQAVSMIYALDTKTPVVKLFTGGVNMACTNLCVFNPDKIFCSELEQLQNINLSPMEILLNAEDDISVKLRKLSETFIDRDMDILKEYLGRWVYNAINLDYSNDISGKVKLGYADVVAAFKELFMNESSDYYIPETKAVDYFTVYNAFTDRICNSNRTDINTKPEKVCLVSKILELD